MRQKIFLLLITVCSSALYADFFRGNDDGTSDSEALPVGYSAEINMFPEGESLLGYHMGFSASFIWWIVSQENMAFATAVGRTTASNTRTDDLMTYYQSFSYNPGFKLALCCDLLTDGWVGMIDYTWLRSSDKIALDLTASATNIVTILPQFFIPDTAVNSASSERQLSGTANLSSTWGVNLNMLDFVASRTYYSGKSLLMSMRMGMRWARLNQTWTIESPDYTVTAGLYVADTTTSPMQFGVDISSFYTRIASKSWLLGLCARHTFYWRIGEIFDVDLYIGGAIFHQQVSLDAVYNVATETVTDGTSDAITMDRPLPAFRLDDVRDKLSRASLESGIGISYNMKLFDDTARAKLSFRYDALHLFSQNVLVGETENIVTVMSGATIARLDATNALGNLNYQGLSVELAVNM